MDWGFFRDFLNIDSTSGKERKVAEWLVETLPGLFPASNRPALRVDEVGDGTLNLLLTWGTPRIVFCSHLDTVPPYIQPTLTDTAVYGRGACDAKGQVFAMVSACQRLAEEGCTDFGLLLLAGEETGSWGAKAFAKTDFRAPYLVVGEPTDNCMVSASKGTKSFDLKFTGEAFHSGYPQYGVSAVNLFVEFVNQLKAKDFGLDPILGETTWNIGLLKSDNPQNILSPELTCRIYFRTTFVSDEAVSAWMNEAADGRWFPGAFARIGSRSDAEANHLPSAPIPASLTVSPRGGDTPARYWTVEGIPSKSVAFGSDAPHLKNFTHKAICGPGSITVAHRDDEHVLVADLETAVEQYIKLYKAIL
jgi:acetylornithine deacetylase